MKIGLVGLGLIGGSLAKSVKVRTLHSVLGFDSDGETMTLARLWGAVDRPLEEENLSSCNLIFISLRPGAAIRWVKEHAPQLAKTAILVDMCGVKRTVYDRLAPIAKQYGFTYVGGHPMAGKERGGFVNSSPDLFSGASMILTPDKEADIFKLELLHNFFLDIGFASVTFSNPEEHDQIIAYTSQLAHLVSSAYIKSPRAQFRRGFSAGSFNDLTRVARLDEEMWTELFMENADYLLAETTLLIEHLKEYHTALKDKNTAVLRNLLREGRQKKAQAGGY